VFDVGVRGRMLVAVERADLKIAPSPDNLTGIDIDVVVLFGVLVFTLGSTIGCRLLWPGNWQTNRRHGFAIGNGSRDRPGWCWRVV
jgi:hypothetical protein